MRKIRLRHKTEAGLDGEIDRFLRVATRDELATGRHHTGNQLVGITRRHELRVISRRFRALAFLQRIIARRHHNHVGAGSEQLILEGVLGAASESEAGHQGAHAHHYACHRQRSLYAIAQQCLRSEDHEMESALHIVVSGG